jgi:hypothetical protein
MSTHRLRNPAAPLLLLLLTAQGCADEQGLVDSGSDDPASASSTPEADEAPAADEAMAAADPERTAVLVAGEPDAPATDEATPAPELERIEVPVVEEPGATEPETDPSGGADPLLVLTGLVISELNFLEAPLEVGVLWLNLLDDNTTVLVEAAEVDAIGTSLPAAFDVSLIAPPSPAMLGATLDSWSEGGATERPVDASRVAFGVVVVAPEGTLAALPSSTTLSDFISASDASAGPLLSSFTFVSPYAVRYVEGAEAEGVVLRDINGVPYALTDFTLIDLGAWARGIDDSLCRDRFLGEGWATPEVLGCIEANAERIAVGEAAAAACAEACPEPAADEFDYCNWDCTTQGDTSGNVQNECLFAWGEEQAGAIDVRCGASPDWAESDFRSARRLDAGEAVTLTLDEGDIRSALTAGGFTFLY